MNNLLRVPILFCLVLSVFGYLFPNQHKLIINSSHSQITDVVSISLASWVTDDRQKDIDFNFNMNSGELFGVEDVKFTHQKDNMKIEPALPQDSVLYNDITTNEHWLGFKIKFAQWKNQSQQKLVNFIPVHVVSGQYQQSFLLTLTKAPMSLLSIRSFYKCDNTLISVQVINNMLDIGVFDKTGNWSIEGEWNRSYKHNDHGIHYGRYTSKDINRQFEIKLDTLACQINSQSLHKQTKQQDYSIQKFRRQYPNANVNIYTLSNIAKQLPKAKKSAQKTNTDL